MVGYKFAINVMHDHVLEVMRMRNNQYVQQALAL